MGNGGRRRPYIRCELAESTHCSSGTACTPNSSNRKSILMDALRQAYPTVDDIYLRVALDDADGDVVDALEMLLVNIGEPNKGQQI